LWLPLECTLGGYVEEEAVVNGGQRLLVPDGRGQQRDRSVRANSGGWCGSSHVGMQVLEPRMLL
jgi:hypothetical protein